MNARVLPSRKGKMVVAAARGSENNRLKGIGKWCGYLTGQVNVERGKARFAILTTIVLNFFEKYLDSCRRIAAVVQTMSRKFIKNKASGEGENEELDFRRWFCCNSGREEEAQPWETVLSAIDYVRADKNQNLCMKGGEVHSRMFSFPPIRRSSCLLKGTCPWSPRFCNCNLNAGSKIAPDEWHVWITQDSSSLFPTCPDSVVEAES